jgi:hypothetical protein
VIDQPQLPHARRVDEQRTAVENDELAMRGRVPPAVVARSPES